MNYFNLIIGGWLLLFLGLGNCTKNSSEIPPLLKPHQFTGESSGCASFIVFRLSEDKTEGIVVKGQREKLSLTTTAQTFDLESNEFLSVRIDKFNGQAENYYCDDVIGDDPEIVNSWNGIKGLVTIRIIEDNIETPPTGPIYRLSVRIENLELSDESGDIINISEIDFSDVLVGWLPG